EIRPQIPELVAGVVADALDDDAVQTVLRLRELGEPVGQLDLAAGARLGAREVAPDRGRQHVAADDRPPARRRARFRLLDHLADPPPSIRAHVAGNDAVHVLLAR